MHSETGFMILLIIKELFNVPIPLTIYFVALLYVTYLK